MEHRNKWYQIRRSSDRGGEVAASRWEQSRQEYLKQSRLECIKSVQSSVQDLLAEIRDWRLENQAMHIRLLSDLQLAKNEKSTNLASIVDKGADVAVGESSSADAPPINNKENVDLEDRDSLASSIVHFDEDEKADLVSFNVEENVVIQKADLVLCHVDEKVEFVPFEQPSQCRPEMNRLQSNRSSCKRNRHGRSSSLTNSYVVFAPIIGGRRYMIHWTSRFRFLKLPSLIHTFRRLILCSVSAVSVSVCMHMCWNASLGVGVAMQCVWLNSGRLCDWIDNGESNFCVWDHGRVINDSRGYFVRKCFKDCAILSLAVEYRIKAAASYLGGDFYIESLVEILLNQLAGNENCNNSPRYRVAVQLQKGCHSFKRRRKFADCAILIEKQWWMLLDYADLKQTSVPFFDIDKPKAAVSGWTRAINRAVKVAIDLLFKLLQDQTGLRSSLKQEG